MISTSCFALNWKTLPLVLVIFTIFTVSLSDNLQVADGLAAGGDKMIYELYPGESQMLTWFVMNDEDKDIDLEFYATGEGSELFVFEEYLTLPGKTNKKFEIFVVVPEDHPNNIEYHPELFVLTRGEKIEAGAGIVMNMQMKVIPFIKIGDNPIYTAPPTVYEVIDDDADVKDPVPETKTVEEKEQVESLAEKLARINTANQANAPKELIVDDTWEEEAVPELQVDDNYLPEPIAQVKQVPLPIEEKIECDFIAMILSWFGFGKC